MKHILFLTRSQFGYQTDYFYFCKYLTRNYRITIICIDAGRIPFNLDNISVFYVKKSKVIDIVTFWFKSFRLLLKEKPELIIINSFPFSFLLPLIFGNERFLLDIRSGGVSKNFLRRRYRNIQIRLNISFNKNISVISDSLAKSLNINKSNYHILPLGAEVFSSKKKVFDNIKLFYIGTFNGRSLTDTITGFARFYSEFKDQLVIEYHIVGDGKIDEVNNLVEITKKEGLLDVVKLHGRQTHAEAKRFFDVCNIGVSYVPVNAYYDVQPPTKTFEYLCSGFAVIATNTLENSNVIIPENGILIEDNAESFYEGLKEIHSKLSKFSSDSIQKNSFPYTWEYIVQNKFRPIIESIKY